MIIRNENKILTINRIYRVALLTLSRIKNNKVSFISNLQKRKIIKLKNKIEFAIKDVIKNYYLNQKSSFTIKDVLYYLLLLFNESKKYYINKKDRNKDNEKQFKSFKQKVQLRPINEEINMSSLWEGYFQ